MVINWFNKAWVYELLRISNCSGTFPLGYRNNKRSGLLSRALTPVSEDIIHTRLKIAQAYVKEIRK